MLSLDHDATIEQALQVLARENISSAPVFNKHNNTWLGHLSCMDILLFVLKLHGNADADKLVSAHFDAPVLSILTADSQLPLIADESPLTQAVVLFNQSHVHQLVAVDQTNAMTGLLSQFDIISLLHLRFQDVAEEPFRFPPFSLTVRELGLVPRSVISVVDSSTLARACSIIYGSHVHGVAIVDEEGNFVNNLSASDFKGITKQNFHALDVPIAQLISKKLRPVTCHPETTLAQAVELFVSTGVHRIFILNSEGPDSNTKVVGLITLSDVLRIIAQVH